MHIVVGGGVCRRLSVVRVWVACACFGLDTICDYYSTSPALSLP